MKPLVDNPKEPIPLFRKNDAGEFVSLVDTQGRELFACGECRIIQQTYGTPYESALRCCKQPYCECGNKIEYTGYTVCSSCRDKSRLEKAEEVSDNGKAVTLFDHDEFHNCLDDLVDSLHDDLEPDAPWPEWASPTEEIKWDGLGECDVESMIENSLQDFHDEADEWIVDYKELVEFVNKWSEKQNITSYQVISGKKVRIPPRPPIEVEDE